jgi:nitrate reductase gamma subunit
VLDVIAFAVFPYVALALAVAGSLYRYFTDRFTYSAQSSQFLETNRLFWGSTPWHYAIIAILLAHLLALILPGVWAGLLSSEARLIAMEVTGMALGLTAVSALGLLVLRRLTNRRALVLTSAMDWVMLALLLAQCVLGLWTAVFFRWGSQWYLTTAVPWLASLAALDPQIQLVTALPLVVRLHFFLAFATVAAFPFTRLVHMISFPITYLWRPYQVVIWNRRSSRER